MVLWHAHTHTAALSCIVASLRVTSTSTISFIIEWGRVLCRDRNAEITWYTVTHIPVSGGNEVKNLIFDVGSTNELHLTDLSPSTAYTVQVRADHIRFSEGSFLFGTMCVTVTATTSVLEGKVVI